MTCPSAARSTVPGRAFLPQLRHRAAAIARPVAERRIVTVLFGDLSDFTAWSEDLDPERVGAVTDRVLAALAGAVKTFGGHVDKLTGDGIMAVFGAPVAHEDDAERAVRAALSMQRAVRRVLDDERGGGAPSGLRVGLNTGEVVAGVQAGSRIHGDRRRGEHRRPAGRRGRDRHRVRRRAHRRRPPAGSPPGGRCVRCGSRASARRSRRFELLGLLDAPGTRSGMGDEAPFVGRETELAWVASRLAEVDDSGEPRVLLLTAEAGLGKTRFAAQVAAARGGLRRQSPRFVAGAGTRVLAVQCAAYGERRRLGPLTDLVRVAIGLPTEVGSGVTRASIEERLNRLATRLGWAPGSSKIDLLTAALAAGDVGQDRDGSISSPWRGDPDGFDVEAVPTAVAELLSGLATGEPAARRSSTTCTTRRPRRSTRSAPCCPSSTARSSCCCSAGRSWCARPAR